MTVGCFPGNHSPGGTQEPNCGTPGTDSRVWTVSAQGAPMSSHYPKLPLLHWSRSIIMAHRRSQGNAPHRAQLVKAENTSTEDRSSTDSAARRRPPSLSTQDSPHPHVQSSSFQPLLPTLTSKEAVPGMTSFARGTASLRFQACSMSQTARTCPSTALGHHYYLQPAGFAASSASDRGHPGEGSLKILNYLRRNHGLPTAYTPPPTMFPISSFPAPRGRFSSSTPVSSQAASPHSLHPVRGLHPIQGASPHSGGFTPSSRGLTPSSPRQGLPPHYGRFSPALRASPHSGGFTPFRGLHPVQEGSTPFTGLHPVQWASPIQGASPNSGGSLHSGACTRSVGFTPFRAPPTQGASPPLRGLHPIHGASPHSWASPQFRGLHPIQGLHPIRVGFTHSGGCTPIQGASPHSVGFILFRGPHPIQGASPHSRNSTLLRGLHPNVLLLPIVLEHLGEVPSRP